jgi:hypothetical protein
MTIQIGDPVYTSNPPVNGVYVVRYWFSMKEEYAYWAGQWSVAAADPVEASKFVDAQGEIKFNLVSRKRKVKYWRTYSNDGGALVEALKKAMGG